MSKKNLLKKPKSNLTQGVKHDSNKSPMDLLPFDSLDEIAKVLAFGEIKYAAGNWANGISTRRLISATMRHILQFNSGEDNDPESGLSHLAHAGCNIVFALWMMKNRPDMDNRWVKNINNKGIKNDTSKKI